MNSKERIRLRIAYDGTEFSGFQALKGRRSVQGTLQDALSRHCGEPIHVYGAGRTDAGVHASGQVVHFDTSSRTPAEKYPEALYRYLPKDLSILDSEVVESGFHARFSAKSRVYRYAIVPGGRSPLVGRFSWMPGETPDWEIFKTEAERLIGEHDFAMFRSGTDAPSTVRTMFRAELNVECGYGTLTLEANAFLRGMVRWIVRSLWHRATGRMSDDDLTQMIEGRSRPATLIPAPPQGLCLVRVRYDAGDRGSGDGDQ